MFELRKNIPGILLDNFPLSDAQKLVTDPIFDFVSQGITLTDLEGFILACNKATLKLHGFDSIDEIIGINAIELVVPKDRKKAKVNSLLTFKNGAILQDKYTCLKKKGDTFTAEINASLIKDKEGNPIGYLGITSDISEIESANEQLRLLITALESAANEVVITDQNGTIIWVNSSFNEVTGYTDNEAIGQNPRILKSGMHEQQFYTNMWEIISSGKVWSGEVINKNKNGEIYTEEMTITPIEDGNGKISNYIAIKQNITSRKKVEQELLESELKYRSIFENSTMGIYRADSEGNILVSNTRFLDILGIPSIANLKTKYIDLEFYLEPSTRKKFHKILLDEGKVYGFETQWKRADGNIIHIRESATGFWNSEGKFDYYEGTVEDLTDSVIDKREIKKQAEIFKALRYSSELFLRNVNWQNNMQMAIAVIGEAISTSAIQVFKNVKNAEKLVIYKQISIWENTTHKINVLPEELNLTQYGIDRWEKELSQNKIITGLVNDLPIIEKTFLAAFGVKSIIIVPIILDGSCWGEIVFHQSDYDRVWNNSEIEALRAASETLSAAVKRSNYEKELIEAKKEAESADKTKSEFLAQISHEIRTPLNNIINFNTLIKEELKDTIDSSVKGCFDVIDTASQRLIRTIGLILNLSELHTDSYKLENSNFDLISDLLERIYQENIFIAKQRNIDFILTNNASSTLIYADKYSLEQIFHNLLNNAFKYTEKGKVKIEIENNEKNQIIVKISDSGIGISQVYLPNIFNPFSQEEAGYTRKYDGNGIGLTLVKKYCELNKIKIEVNSKKNIGTTFILTLNTKTNQ